MSLRGEAGRSAYRLDDRNRMGDVNTMRVRWSGYFLAALLALWLGTPGASGSVNLVLVPSLDSAPVGRYVDVALYAVSDEGTEFLAMDVVLTWDSEALEMIEVIDNGPHDWDFLFGFVPDGQLDGLNDSLLDGDALFEALSFTRATATVDGLLVATFRFSTISDTPSAEIAIEEGLDLYNPTKVYAEGGDIITGSLGSTTVEVASVASLSVTELAVPAGRVAELVVSGEIDGAETIGVTVTLELSPGAGSVGDVSFTPAPPVDIEIVSDPWSEAGTFSPFDTDITSSGALNGSVLDNGTYEDLSMVFAEDLVSFPVVVSGEAKGVWDVRLCSGGCTAEDAISMWDTSFPTPIPTALYHNVLRVVALGDGDGSEAIDIRDYSDFQVCFTGNVGPVDPPAYAPSSPQQCRVYDFDDDGDIGFDDYVAFRDVMWGPAP